MKTRLIMRSWQKEALVEVATISLGGAMLAGVIVAVLALLVGCYNDNDPRLPRCPPACPDYPTPTPFAYHDAGPG